MPLLRCYCSAVVRDITRCVRRDSSSLKLTLKVNQKITFHLWNWLPAAPRRRRAGPAASGWCPAELLPYGHAAVGGGACGSRARGDPAERHTGSYAPLAAVVGDVPVHDRHAVQPEWLV